MLKLLPLGTCQTVTNDEELHILIQIGPTEGIIGIRGTNAVNHSLCPLQLSARCEEFRINIPNLLLTVSEIYMKPSPPIQGDDHLGQTNSLRLSIRLRGSVWGKGNNGRKKWRANRIKVV